MTTINASPDIDLSTLAVGQEWEASSTPPGDRDPGCWVVRRRRESFALIFRADSGPEYDIHSMPDTKEGRRIIKYMAHQVVKFAWEKKG
jgi:hypothetical protein